MKVSKGRGSKRTRVVRGESIKDPTASTLSRGVKEPKVKGVPVQTRKT